MIIIGGELSPVLDKTMSAAMNVSEFIYENDIEARATIDSRKQEGVKVEQSIDVEDGDNNVIDFS